LSFVVVVTDSHLSLVACHFCCCLLSHRCQSSPIYSPLSLVMNLIVISRCHPRSRQRLFFTCCLSFSSLVIIVVLHRRRIWSSSSSLVVIVAVLVVVVLVLVLVFVLVPPNNCGLSYCACHYYLFSFEICHLFCEADLFFGDYFQNFMIHRRLIEDYSYDIHIIF